MTTLIDYALMAGRAYQTTRDKTNWFPVPQGWTLFFPVPDQTTAAAFPVSAGFEAVSFQNIADPNIIVISYAGTYANPDSLSTNPDMQADLALGLGMWSAQLGEAADYYLQVRKDNPNAHITLTGHSLGGGLAALIGVFFGETAFTFDQAPFAETAKFQAQALMNYLVNEGKYTTEQLAGLTHYIDLQQTDVTLLTPIPNQNLVTNISVEGQLLAGFPYSLVNTIGSDQQPPLASSHADVAGEDLHSQALLAAFLQSQQTAATGKALNEVTYKLTDLLKMIFDKNLFAHDTDTTEENFLDRLVRHEFGNAPGVTTADAMVTRFTSDMWKLAQDGGLTMTDWAPLTGMGVPDNVRKTLIAFDMQKYYEETNQSAGYNKALFTDISTEGGSNGIRFAMTDVSARLQNEYNSGKGMNLTAIDPNNTGQYLLKGYQYFQTFMSESVPGTGANPKQFTPEEQQLINSLLPYMRDWYVQAGASGMLATDTLNRGAFMLGGTGSDALVGGTASDLLVGNAGDDLLQGGLGNDFLLGGAGNDTYQYTSGDGLDTILDTDGNGSIVVDSVTLAGGDQYGDELVHRDGNGHLYVDVGQGRMVIDGNILIEGYQPTLGNGMGLTMDGPAADTLPAIQTGNTINGDMDPQLNADGTFVVDTWGNIISDGQAAPDRADTIYDTSANDLINTGGGNDDVWKTRGGDDIINLGAGDDNLWTTASATGRLIVNGGDGRDYIGAGSGRDIIEGGAGADGLYGSAEGDYIYGDVQIDAATAIAQGATETGTGQQGEWVDAEDGNDQIITGAGNDLIAGGAGDDLIVSGGGDDYIRGDWNTWSPDQTWRNWTLTEQVATDANGTVNYTYDITNIYTESDTGTGNDVIYAGAGNDVVFGERGNDVIFGEAGNDKLTGGEGNDVILGGAGQDLIGGDGATGNGNDYLDGGAEDDIISGDAGDDIIIGGTGNDTLYGGAGNDTYIYNVGDGIDTIYDNIGEHNILRFGAGVNSSDIHLNLGSLMLDLGNGDEIHIANFDRNDVFNSSSIGSFEFADGTTLSTTELLARGFDLDGTAGDDTIYGTNTNDRISGMGGNDYMAGGAGNDTYLLNLGDGQDTIVDSPDITGNVIRFGAGISAGNTQFLQQSADLLIKYGTQGDAALIQNFAPNGIAGGQVISQFQFADGSQGAYTTDGMGNASMKAYDANGLLVADFWQTQNGGYGNDTYTYNAQGIKVGDSWTKSDGSYGSDVFNSDGSSSGTSFYVDGTTSAYTNDGLGNILEISYNNQGIKTGDSWNKADSSHGNDVFNSDGSSLGSVYDAPGTNVPHRTYTIDSYGNKETINYDAAGSVISDIWIFANGNYRTESFNSDGSSTGTTYHADGSYSTFTNDGLGQTITQNYSFNNTLTGSSVTETNGLHNIITAYDSPIGVKLNETWVHSDGSSGTDRVSALDFNGSLNLPTGAVYDNILLPDGSSGMYMNNGDQPAPFLSRSGLSLSNGSGCSSTIYGSASLLTHQLGNVSFDDRTTGAWFLENENIDGTKSVWGYFLVGTTWQVQASQQTLPTQAAITLTVHGLNGAYSTFKDDGQGNQIMVSYDANGVKLEDSWSHNDATMGGDYFYADGSSSGISMNPGAGVVTTYTDDGHQHVTMANQSMTTQTLAPPPPPAITPPPDITPPPPPPSLNTSPGTGNSMPNFYITTSPDNQGGTYVTQIMSDGSVHVAHLDANGNVLSGGLVQTDPGYGANAVVDGKQTGWTYDDAGIPTSSYSDDGLGNITIYYYDGQGHVTRFGVATTDSQGVSTLFYDAAGQLTGSSTKLTTGSGQVTTTTYDATGQLTGSSLAVTDGQSNTVTSSYDAAGVLLSFSTTIVTSAGAVEITSYDAQGVATGVIVTSTDGLGVITTHTFDATGKYAGSVIATPDSAGNYTTCNYDATGTLTGSSR